MSGNLTVAVYFSAWKEAGVGIYVASATIEPSARFNRRSRDEQVIAFDLPCTKVHG